MEKDSVKMNPIYKWSNIVGVCFKGFIVFDILSLQRFVARFWKKWNL